MRRIVSLLTFLCFLLSTPLVFGQSKAERLEAKLATASEKDKAKIYNQLAEVYYSSNPKKSLENADKALKIALSTKDIGAQASAHVNLGLAKVRLGKRQTAVGNFKSALKIYEKHKSEQGMAYIYVQLGICYEGMSNSNPAITYFQKAIPIHKKLNNNPGLSRSLVGIGDAYLKKDQTTKAIAKYNEAIPYYKAARDNEGVARAHTKIGIAYSNFGNYTEAQKILNKALAIAKVNNLSALKSEILRSLAIVEKNMEGTEKSEFEKEEEAKVEEHIQELETKSSLLEGKTSDFLAKIATLDEESRYNAMLVKIKEDALKQETLLKEKKAQELDLATKEKEVTDAKLAATQAEVSANEAEIERKNAIGAGLVGGLILLALIVFLIFNRYQQKRKANNLLAQQNKEITEQNIEITEQKEEISGQKEKLEQQKAQLVRTNTQMTDSIDYAKRIQSALLSSRAKIRRSLPESFILFKPKAVVSGDFYWIKEQNGNVMFAAADCTGHGVPGAFMSIISNNVLNDVTTQYSTTNPGEILKLASNEIIYRLQDKEAQTVISSDGTKTEWEVKDGMDIALCSLNRTTLQMQYAGAHNPLYIIRNGELIEYRGDRLFIGNTDESTVFKTHEIQLQKGDMLYVFSDGFPDQKGGPESKKFYYQPFQAMLMQIHQMGMDEQQIHLDRVITEWMGNTEQIDDIIIFGVKV